MRGSSRPRKSRYLNRIPSLIASSNNSYELVDEDASVLQRAEYPPAAIRVTFFPNWTVLGLFTRQTAYKNLVWSLTLARTASCQNFTKPPLSSALSLLFVSTTPNILHLLLYVTQRSNNGRCYSQRRRHCRV